MAGITRTARAEWQGTGKEGKGTLTTQSGVLSTTPYGFNTRFGEREGHQPRGAGRGGACGLLLDGAGVRADGGGLHADQHRHRRRR